MPRVAHYCTYFDHRFLPVGLALIESMRRHCGDFTLWVLCLSDECHAALLSLALPGIIPVALPRLEADDPRLLEAKRGRPAIEYYYTCGPAFMAWLFEKRSDIKVLTYLDADLFFFADPRFLLDQMEGFSTLIVPHNYSPRNARLTKITGIYNVGWLSFRRDADGLACLQWWRERCLESCARTGGYCGDQMYLDAFPERFHRVLISRHPGVNVAPWNLDNYQFSVGHDRKPRVDGEPIVFFHFSELRRVTSFLWRAPYSNFGAPVTRIVRSTVFRPYLRVVRTAEKASGYRLPPPRLKRGATLFRRNRFLAALRELAALVVRGGGIWVFGGRTW